MIETGRLKIYTYTASEFLKPEEYSLVHHKKMVFYKKSENSNSYNISHIIDGSTNFTFNGIHKAYDSTSLKQYFNEYNAMIKNEVDNIKKELLKNPNCKKETKQSLKDKIIEEMKKNDNPTLEKYRSERKKLLDNLLIKHEKWNELQMEKSNVDRIDLEISKKEKNKQIIQLSNENYDKKLDSMIKSAYYNKKVNLIEQEEKLRKEILEEEIGEKDDNLCKNIV